MSWLCPPRRRGAPLGVVVAVAVGMELLTFAGGSMVARVDSVDVLDRWRADGYVKLPGYLTPEELTPALADLEETFPTAEGFHDRRDPRHEHYRRDEFDGIATFPFPSVELSLLAVSSRLVDLAEHLLGSADLRIYSAEAWAKYTGATSYEQDLHRDYLGHTLVVPTDADCYQQLEMFVFLCDVPEELGPPHLVSTAHTRGLPSNPNWFPRRGGGGDFVSAGRHEDLYELEVSGTGPAGTVIAFTPGTLHRGTDLRLPRGVRYSMQLGYRPAQVDWAQRQAWAERSHSSPWYQFVARATPRQLQLFGFPPPGHPYWTPGTLDGVQQRYPTLDLTPWRAQSMRDK